MAMVGFDESGVIFPTTFLVSQKRFGKTEV